MLVHIYAILEYVAESFIHIWPYLLITIPIAVAVQMSGASKYISRAFTARPLVAIVLATAVGAFSPLCSCSVVPVVAAMLIGGVPLAPVMSFWLASPSMDPEIFFLTVGSLGWDLAVWRLISTLVLSLSGGFIVNGLTQRNLLGEDILRSVQSIQAKTLVQVLKDVSQTIKSRMRLQDPRHGILLPALVMETPTSADQGSNCIEIPDVQFQAVTTITSPASSISQSGVSQTTSCTDGNQCGVTEKPNASSFGTRLAKETWMATTMVIKFMVLAWIIGAFINLYVPEGWINGILGGENAWSIFTAALLGVPVYTSNLTAMPLVGGLLTQGMHPAAALAFLIAGPITTLPAMSAVWGLVNRKVFALYIGFALVGAVVMGYAYHIVLVL